MRAINLKAMEYAKAWIYEDLEKFLKYSEDHEITKELGDLKEKIEFYENLLNINMKGLFLNKRELRESLRKLTSLYFHPIRALVLTYILKQEVVTANFFEEIILIPRSTIHYHLKTMRENEILDIEVVWQEMENNFGMTKIKLYKYFLNPKIRKLLIKYRVHKQIYEVLTYTYILLEYYENNFPDHIHLTNPDLQWWNKEKTLKDYLDEYQRLLRRKQKLRKIIMELGGEEYLLEAPQN